MSISKLQAIRNVTENLKLQPILTKTVRTCSGGMKRKLSLAIALLGDPAFVLLVRLVFHYRRRVLYFVIFTGVLMNLSCTRIESR